MEVDMSDESGSSSENRDPTYVPVLRPMVVLNRTLVASPDKRLDEGAADVGSSDDSLSLINETMKRRKNPDRSSTGKNKSKIVSTDSERDTLRVTENYPTEKVYKAMSVPELSACAFETIKKAEEVNIKSKNLKGGLKGQLRDSIANMRGIFHAMTLKINAKGDIEFLRADVANEKARNIELTAELHKKQTEIQILNIRVNEKEETIKQLKDRMEGREEEIDGRKRRRVLETSPPANSTIRDNAGMQIDCSSDMGNRYSAEIEKFKEEARFCHNETIKIARDMKKLLAESRIKKRDKLYEKPEEKREREERIRIIEDIHKLIGEFLNDDETEGKKKPRIKSIESIDVPYRFEVQEYRPKEPIPSTSWADIDAQIPWRNFENTLKENHNVNSVNNTNIELGVRNRNYTRATDQIHRRTNINQANREHDINKLKQLKLRNTKSAAITITCEDNTKYSEIISKAKREINLTEYDIEECKIRRGYNGGLVMEISGGDAASKADRLAAKITEVMTDENVRIVRPSKRISIKIIGFDEATNKEELIEEMVKICECEKQNMRISEVRRTTRGIGFAWITCSLDVAIKLLETNKARIGWTMVRFEMANSRPMRCFKCLEAGHSKYNCRSAIDRSGNCFNCGEMGHTANNCVNRPSCMICIQYNKPHRHRMGGNECHPITIEDRRRNRDRRPVHDYNEENRYGT